LKEQVRLRNEERRAAERYYRPSTFHPKRTQKSAKQSSQIQGVVVVRSEVAMADLVIARPIPDLRQPEGAVVVIPFRLLREPI